MESFENDLNLALTVLAALQDKSGRSLGTGLAEIEALLHGWIRLRAPARMPRMASTHTVLLALRRAVWSPGTINPKTLGVPCTQVYQLGVILGNVVSFVI